MSRFRRLYIDTSVLISSNWPRISTNLERIFQLCDLVRVDLFLPKPVEDELQTYWLETYRDKCRKAYNAHEEISKHLSFLKHDWKPTFPTEEAVMEEFRKRTQEIKEKWKIGSIPLTSRNLDEIFRFAVEHHAPFAKEDKGFKDTVIYFSVIDHLAKTASIQAAFVSFDKIFGDPKVTELTKSIGVDLAMYSNIEDVDKELTSWVEGVMKTLWQKDTQRAEESIKKKTTEVEKFLLDTFEVSESEFGFGSRVVAVQGLELKAIRNVRTPPLDERRKDEPVRISFEAQIELNAIVEQTYIPPPPSKLKVGERGPKYEGINLGALLAGPTQQERVLPWNAEIEATSSPDDKEYETITFVSARSKGMSLRDMMVGLTLDSLLAQAKSAPK
jgi:hypothetical protein